MCGIAGYLGQVERSHDPEALLRAMGDAIFARGPDDEGTYVDRASGLGLVHRRLAIIDRSAAGHQPMVSASGQFVVIYNGEIYNHLALRTALEADCLAPNWNGHSDTETLLAAIEAWGLPEALKRSRGMFALALWDRRTRTLRLARDRMGEKPLYVGRLGGMYLFGSDLSALARHPAFEPKIDRTALAHYLRLGYVPAPFSIYQGIGKVSPGTILTIADGAEPTSETYWSFLEQARLGAQDRFQGSPEDAVERLDKLLGDAVERQMLADVPLGAFLSGGIDSSLIVSLMQRRSHHPVQTFTIGFKDPAFNEAAHAHDVARHLGTDHTELILSPEDAIDVVSKLPAIYSEPFADVSQIPTYLISSMARRHVTVALSGDAGDELFGGYNRYLITARNWNWLSRIPAPLRAASGRLACRVPASAWDRLGAMLPGRNMPGRLSDKVHKAARVMSAESSDGLYLELIARANGLASLVIGEHGANHQVLAETPGLEGVERMMALDAIGYLPDDVLVKVDRAAMAVSLETRVPMLDDQVISFALSLSLTHKLRGGRSKWILRELLKRYVPPGLTERPKMGFAVPIGTWLRGPLKEWAEALLDETDMRQLGYLDTKSVHAIWMRHKSGREDLSQILWNILSFQNWLKAAA